MVARSRWVGRSSILGQFDAPDWVRYAVLTISFVGVQLLWSCEMAQASPFLISLGLSKSSMSFVFMAGPLSGLIVQPLVGVLSDSSRSTFGRRRPFIFGGCVVSSLAVLLLGWAREVAALFTTTGTTAHSRLTITFAILSIYVIDFSINVVQAMDRSLLVDVVPPHLQAAANAWASRMFGIGAVAGYWIGGLDLPTLTGKFFGEEQLKVLTFFTAFFLCATHAVTVFCVTERVLISKEDDEVKQGVNSAKLAVMNIWTTLREMPRPIQQVLNVQFTSWIGWFPILFFSTTWVAEVYIKTHGGTDLASSPPAMQDLATRAGSHAMLFHALVSLSTSILLPNLIASTSPPSTTPLRSNPSTKSIRSRLLNLRRTLGRVLPTLPLPWLSLSLLWTLSNGAFAVLLFSTWLATSVGSASFIIAATGFCWAVTNWCPFSLLGDLILRIGAPLPPRSAAQMQWDDDSTLYPPHPSQSEAHHHLLTSSSSHQTQTLSTAIELDDIKSSKPNNKSLRLSSASPTASEMSTDNYFDADPDTPVQSSFSHSISPAELGRMGTPPRSKTLTTSRAGGGGGGTKSTPPRRASHPYGGGGRNEIGASGLRPHTEGANRHGAGTNDVDPFSSTSSFHLEPYSSSTSIQHDPYASEHSSHASGSTTTLQIRHSDSFELDQEEVELNGLRRDSVKLYDNVGEDEEDEGRREVPVIMLGETSVPINGGRWDDRDLGTGEEGEGAEQAGVILGCHNIYLVIPQLIVTALSSIIFALLAPHHTVVGTPVHPAPIPTSPKTVDLVDDLDLRRRGMELVIRILRRAVGLEEEDGAGWDALGLIFRLGGVAVAISTVICYRMTRENERDRLRQLRGTH